MISKLPGSITFLSNEVLCIIFNELPNQKEQFMLEFTSKQMWRNYLKVIQDPTNYKFVSHNSTRFFYSERDLIIYEFSHIEMNKKIAKSKKKDDKKISYGMVKFDKKNQHCMRCKREGLICDTEIKCFICKKNNIPCIKKKEYINKRIYKDKKGMMYCKPLDDYWRIENHHLVHIYKNDIAELGEKFNKCKIC
ncbi:32716_t:CDS:1 [Gigaspora margarita]|uniref:32716_t:CDS:1 n=1 Tax=Gigaspora margarita TaxID=4874 RepID=A0ABN7VTL5_GIGMA|nr:32716_t:CDS:1 [Gigaspora margarita]